MRSELTDDGRALIMNKNEQRDFKRICEARGELCGAELKFPFYYCPNTNVSICKECNSKTRRNCMNAGIICEHWKIVRMEEEDLGNDL